MSETLKVLETRRSCRAFKPELIEEEKLQAIIKAGTYAATGMGRQSPIIIAVTNKELRDKLSVMNAKFMGRMKALIRFTEHRSCSSFWQTRPCRPIFMMALWFWEIL